MTLLENITKMEFAKFVNTGDKKIPAIVTVGNRSTPVWCQSEWTDGEYYKVINGSGCGHTCVAMALRLMGIDDVDPHKGYLHCRGIWGAPKKTDDESTCQYGFLSVSGSAKCIRSYGIPATAYGVEKNGRAKAVDHMLEALKQGKVVLYDSIPTEEYPDNPFSTGAHYVLLCGITKEGKILVANSGTKGKCDFPGIHLVDREVLERSMIDDCYATDLTWGQMIPVHEKAGYVIVG